MAVSRRCMIQEMTPDDADLESWVRRARDGDAEAFDALVGRFYARIYRLAYRMLRNREFAEDAAQEIFLKAWRSLRRFRGASSFVTWLHAIAVNHCLSVARRRSREIARVESMTDPEGGESAFADATEPSAWLRSQAVREAIRRLPDDLRDAIVLRYFAEYSVPEIAAVLGAPERTVYFRLKAGRDRLRIDLKDAEE